MNLLHFRHLTRRRGADGGSLGSSTINSGAPVSIVRVHFKSTHDFRIKSNDFKTGTRWHTLQLLGTAEVVLSEGGPPSQDTATCGGSIKTAQSTLPSESFASVSCGQRKKIMHRVNHNDGKVEKNPRLVMNSRGYPSNFVELYIKVFDICVCIMRLHFPGLKVDYTWYYPLGRGCGRSKQQV